MQMNITFTGKSKTDTVGNLGRDFISNLIIKPRKDLKREKERKPPSNSNFSFLNVESKSLDSRWNLSGIPNFHGVPTARRYINNLSRALWTREETLTDQDFMMPSRVREVLQSEGLQDDVINNAISRDEKKYRKINMKMAEESRLKEKHFPDRPLDFSLRNNDKTSTDNAGGTSSTVCASRRERFEIWRGDSEYRQNSTEQKDDRKVHSLDLGKDFECSIDNELQMEIDRTKWKSDQHAEKMFSGRSFIPPRIVLISSKVTKCHLLSKVLLDDNVLHLIYDFETWSFSDIIDAISQRLDRHRRHCKARSIMVLCQGGPGYIYLVRNYVITPQKLTKPSYRGVVEFWRNLGNLVSKIDPADAAIHIFGFQLSGTEQGTKYWFAFNSKRDLELAVLFQLVPMLQSLMYPNVVKVVAANDDTDEGKDIAGLYFNLNRYKVWKMHQNTSVSDIDFSAAEAELEHKETVKAQRKKSDPTLTY